MVTEDGLVGAVIRAVAPKTGVVAITSLQSVAGVKVSVGNNFLFLLESRWGRIAASCQIFKDIKREVY